MKKDNPAGNLPASSLTPNFNFKEREAAVYALWEKENCFNPDKASKSAPVFNIAMPPPNANGELHLGHCFGYTVMDILGRFHRMQGERVMLLPGKDHAGIQTQVVFEKKLKKEGVNLSTVPTTELFDQCYAFCTDRAQYMRAQEKTIGLSADWSRELFTLDPRLTEIIYRTFTKLWNDGLVYRGKRIVNWSVFSQTAISDVEVEYQEQKGHLWYLVYPLVDGPAEGGTAIKLPNGGSFQIGKPGILTATTRPETMLGDTALAVHPDDPRYTAFVGKRVRLPLTDRVIPIIADKRVDPVFGTGVIKLTPAHDFLDYDVGIEHGLEVLQVIGFDGKMTEIAGPKYQGKTVAECREMVVKDLEGQGLLLDTVAHLHKVPIGERGKDVIEPLLSEQWFISVDKPGKSLKGRALELLQSGKIKIYPERFKVLFEQWLTNLRDWNISRQLWWGHRIPVWYRSDAKGKQEMFVGPTAPQGNGWTQDTDVFDTWFSSGQWAFSTMAAHGLYDLDAADKETNFFPTHTMVMGRDILFFWACRMLLLTSYVTDNVPWKNIFFTGLIRDEHGQKMSKSKGNGVEPKEMIEKYGSDALRLAFVMGAGPGNDLSFSERKVEGYSKFINKIWNAAKLLETRLSSDLIAAHGNKPLTLASSKWLVAEAVRVLNLTTQQLKAYDASIAADELYRFTWTVFCDWYLEMMKALLEHGKPEWATEVNFVARNTFTLILKMLHPFIPFVTEELYQQLPFLRDAGTLALTPLQTPFTAQAGDHSEIQRTMDIVASIRSVKAALNSAHQFMRVALDRPLSEELHILLCSLARVTLCKESDISAAKLLRKPYGVGVVACEVEDKGKYKQHLEKEISQYSGTETSIEKKLAGPFGTQAKPDVIAAEKERLTQAKQALTALRAELAALN